MALDWQPRFPDLVPHRRLKIAGGSTPGPFTVATVPVPDIAAGLTWAPSFPSMVPHRKSQAARMTWTNPPFEAAIAPTSWQPTFPSMVPHHRLNAARMPSVFEPNPGAGVVVAQSLAWQPTYPSRVHHRPPPNVGGSFEPITPAAAVSGIACVELTGWALTAPQLLGAQLTAPTMLSPALGAPSFIDAEIC